MFNPTRNEARDFLFEAWRKFRADLPLTPLETIAADIIGRHPEYHALLDKRDEFVEREYAPEQGETNPFLHLQMHLALHEQVAIDQPRGVRAAHQALAVKCGSTHEAEHAMMDCLAEMIWQAQRYKTPPDAGIYMACLQRKHGGFPSGGGAKN
jgi:hypothetical protein